MRFYMPWGSCTSTNAQTVTNTSSPAVQQGSTQVHGGVRARRRLGEPYGRAHQCKTEQCSAHPPPFAQHDMLTYPLRDVGDTMGQPILMIRWCLPKDSCFKKKKKKTWHWEPPPAELGGLTIVLCH